MTTWTLSDCVVGACKASQASLFAGLHSWRAHQHSCVLRNSNLKKQDEYFVWVLKEQPSAVGVFTLSLLSSQLVSLLQVSFKGYVNRHWCLTHMPFYSDNGQNDSVLSMWVSVYNSDKGISKTADLCTFCKWGGGGGRDGCVHLPHTQTHMHTHTHTRIHADTCTHTHSHTYTCTHTHNTHTHTWLAILSHSRGKHLANTTKSERINIKERKGEWLKENVSDDLYWVHFIWFLCWSLMGYCNCWLVGTVVCYLCNVLLFFSIHYVCVLNCSFFFCCPHSVQWCVWHLFLIYFYVVPSKPRLNFKPFPARLTLYPVIGRARPFTPVTYDNLTAWLPTFSAFPHGADVLNLMFLVC